MVNTEFDQGIADDFYDGDESEDNVKYLWEDEFAIPGDVKEFKIRNNAVYELKGIDGDDQPFAYEIPDMTICECTMEDGSITQIPVSKKLILKTEKFENKTRTKVTFQFLLKSSRKLENPMDGVYILKEHYPQELL